MRVSVCVCMCDCLSASIFPNYTSDLYRLLCVLPMAVARSSFGGVAMHCVFVQKWFYIDATFDY